VHLPWRANLVGAPVHAVEQHLIPLLHDNMICYITR
jgi:hypothetical protein